MGDSLQFIGIFSIFVFIAALLIVLYAIIRYAIIAPLLNRGAESKLREPSTEGISELIGFEPDDSLMEFYKNWPHLEKTEYYLRNKNLTENWFIGGFNALTVSAVKKEIRIAGRNGLPIAYDMDKGTYFVQRNGSILLFSPNVDGGQVLVANSIDEFSSFGVAEVEDVHPEDYE